MKVATWTEDGLGGGDVPGAGGVVKDVEQPAVDDRVEGLAESVEAERVENLEDRPHAAFGGLAPGDPNRSWRDVDAEGVGAAAPGEDRVLAGPTAGVEQCARERAGVRQADKGGLWAADIPGRRRWA